jgi:DNA-directed RNA polymerase specialized sigma24 family protein
MEREQRISAELNDDSVRIADSIDFSVPFENTFSLDGVTRQEIVILEQRVTSNTTGEQAVYLPSLSFITPEKRREITKIKRAVVLRERGAEVRQRNQKRLLGENAKQVLLDLYSELTAEELGQELGVTAGTVYSWLDNFNAEMRRPGKRGSTRK